MFIQQVLIRKNTPELREYLRDKLGYMPMMFFYNDEGCNLVCESQTYHATDSDNKPYCYDCGENEELFKALAALRVDSDYMQLFYCREYNMYLYTSFEGVQYNRDLQCYEYLGNPMYKASAGELIKYLG